MERITFTNKYKGIVEFKMRITNLMLKFVTLAKPVTSFNG
jgi:hypothetical protein